MPEPSKEALECVKFIRTMEAGYHYFTDNCAALAIDALCAERLADALSKENKSASEWLNDEQVTPSVETMKRLCKRKLAEIATLTAQRDRLIAAGDKMRAFILEWRDCLEDVQMTPEEFVCDCGVGDWNSAALKEVEG